MGKVSITVNGRAFAVGCEDGEEEAVAALGRQFDAHVSTLAAQVGQIGDVRLFLMAALVLADHLRESENSIAALEEELEKLRPQKDRTGEARALDEAAQAMLGAARRIETLSKRIKEAATS